MSLPHAILGLLNVMPMTGYDLKHRAFDSSIAHFWQADQAQIYRTLTSLAESGWVECTLEIQAERPNRKVYRITEAGRAELRRWLLEPQSLAVHREPFLVQLFFAGQLDDAAILEHLARQKAAHEAVLQRFAQIEIPAQDSPVAERERALWRLTLDMGIALEQMYLAWLERCEAVVQGFENRNNPPQI